MVTYYIRMNDDRQTIADENATNYRKYLMDLCLWEQLIERWYATIDLHFAKLGRGHAFLEFK